MTKFTANPDSSPFRRSLFFSNQGLLCCNKKAAPQTILHCFLQCPRIVFHPQLHCPTLVWSLFLNLLLRGYAREHLFNPYEICRCQSLRRRPATVWYVITQQNMLKHRPVSDRLLNSPVIYISLKSFDVSFICDYSISQIPDYVLFKIITITINLGTFFNLIVQLFGVLFRHKPLQANGPAIHHVHQTPPGDHVDRRARARLGDPLPPHVLLNEERNM